MKADRKFELILYPDAINYNCQDIILKAQKLFDQWAYILHDSDINLDGTPKKAHFHFIGKLVSNLTPSGVCYQLGCGESSLANIRTWKGAIRYLIHADNPEKFQYPLTSVSSNFNLSSFFELKEDDTTQAKLIYDYIITFNPSLQDMVEYAVNNNLWSAFRRGFAVWCKLINFTTKEERNSYENYRHPQN